ncbi:sensor domain-containing diguanylate cyclase [Aquibacillus sediminis]|uniref:sensor domain-containing diguanylate cyclase n=1 Tax=Aquibacillus sediminis TaxID=2574734 RepID=UPI0011099FA7|nr:diguanylate cyclase [Aquibacillus sediminis]
MDRQRLIQSELRNVFIDRFTDHNSEITESFLHILSNDIKTIIQAELVAFYLYNNHDDYELVTSVSPYQVKRSLIQENVLVLDDTNPLTIMALNSNDIFLQANNMSSYLLSLETKEATVRQGYMLIAFRDQIRRADYQPIFHTIMKEISFLFQYFGNYDKTKQKAQKYELLFHLSKRIYASIDIRDVLTQTIHTLTEIFPHYDYQLLLSIDYQEQWPLPIKPLNYSKHYRNEPSTQAYLTGNVQTEEQTSRTKLNVPLKGKQGVYGVLQINAMVPNCLLERDVKFITSLVDITGKALENAKLFQQSRQLITDLQLINETAHALNSNLRLSEMVSLMKQQIKDSFAAEEVGFLLFDQEPYHVLDGSTDYFLSKHAVDFINFTIDKLNEERDSLFISDYAATITDVNIPYQSVMAFPIMQVDQVNGAIIVLHHQSNYFTFESFKLIQSMVHHSSLAIANSLLREQLEQLVITDYLTKLYSREYLDHRLQNHFQTDQQGVFILIDIDDFKYVNDRYGHDVGDQLLIQVATIITNHVQTSGFAARWGGEELAIYLPQATVEQGKALARQLVHQVATATNPHVTISVGIAYWNDCQKVNSNQLFNRADQALYKAKRLGKNCVMEAE